MARPTTYTPELGAFIVDQMAEGRSLKDIAAEEGMPKVSTVGQWRAKHPEFAALYAHARQLAGDAEADLAKHYAEQTHIRLPNGMYVPVDPQRSRLMADTAKWRSSRLNQKDWGDKTHVEHSGSIAFTDMTDEDLLNAIMELIAQGKFDLPNGVKLVADGDEPEAYDHSEFA
jgi:hypothetical protein